MALMKRGSAGVTKAIQTAFTLGRLLMVIAVIALLPYPKLLGQNQPAPSPSLAQESRTQHETRMKWWTEARFGMFVNWDMSSIPGTEISWSRRSARPLDVDKAPAGKVEDAFYDHLYQQFNPTKFNATELVRLAQDAGAKYIVFDVKHHAGFCMWDTKLTDYSIMHAPYQRDVLKQVVDACHEANMPLGLYYSPRDWHHPDYGVGDNSKYTSYMKGQLTELLTRYGKIDCLWFDGFGAGDSIQFWHADEMLALIKKLQPDVIINNRLSNLWFPGNHNRISSYSALCGDHDTPEGTVGSFQNHRPWETCDMIIHTPSGYAWSYRADQDYIRPLGECIQMLASCATGDGNLLLDIGPNALGEIPADQAGRLREMGEWMLKHGGSIYQTRGGPFRNGKWGGSTYKGNTVYLHVFKWNGERLVLPPLKAKIVQCSVEFQQTAKGITLTLPKDKQDPTDTVLTLQLSGPAVDEMKNNQPLTVEK